MLLADNATGLIDSDIKPDDGDNGNDNEKRNALRDRGKLWRSRVIPYVLSASLGKLILNQIFL